MSFESRIEKAISSFVNIDKLNGIELPESLKEKLVDEQLDKMAALAEKLFNKPEDAMGTDAFFDFMKTGFVQILTNIVEESDKLPPNLIAECEIGEAAFSNARDRKPIIATDALATCVGVAGYAKEFQSGFVIHFSHPEEIDESGKILCDKIRAMGPKQPIEIHLRGGIKGYSEPLVRTVEKWIEMCNKNGCLMKVASKEVCVKELLDEQGFPNTMSLSLDTRNGSIDKYDAATNPFSKIQVEREADRKRNVDDVLREIFTSSLLHKPEIKIVYQTSS